MKKLLKTASVFTLLFLAGCGTTTADAENTTNTTSNVAMASFNADTDLVYTYNDIPLKPKDVFEANTLGTLSEYYENQSCGFVGLDKIYTYETIEVYTYPDGDHDKILEIVLFDSAKTNKNIQIGSTKADLLAAYGNDFVEEGMNIQYASHDIALSFLILDNLVEEIRYIYIV